MSSRNRQMTAPAAGQDEVRSQIAALCWRMHGGRREILLITSRDTGRWVVPKGWPMEGRSPSEAAALEAWEEAGVEGRIEGEAIGSFSYDKVLRRARTALPCEVEVFPLRVERLTDDYPERRQRRRKWFSPGKAARKVDEPELRSLILHFAAAVEGGGANAAMTGEAGGEAESAEAGPNVKAGAKAAAKGGAKAGAKDGD